jgi:hypothetical protein
MFFILFTFFVAFLIEGLGTTVSVIGLSTLFGANLIIIALAVALDLGKIAVVSLLYTHWSNLGKIMRSYAFVASAVTMIITSAGASAYLSGEFQKAILGTQEIGLKVEVLKKQAAKYEDRKKQIDEQISNLPTKTTVNQRLRLMNGFKAEQKDLQDKIAALDKELPAMQVTQIGTEAKAGPIIYISKAFDIPVESAVKYVILMIIFVFDPLAVFLIIAGNFLLAERKRNNALTGTTSAVEPEFASTAPEPIQEEPQDSERTAQDFYEDGIYHKVDPEVLKKFNEKFNAREISRQEAIVPPVVPRYDGLMTIQEPSEVNQDVDIISADEYIPESETSTTEAPAEVITLNDLANIHHSALHGIKADETVTFESNPRTRSALDYKNLK